MSNQPIQEKDGSLTVNVEGGEVIASNPVGRPSDYDPSFCAKAIELGNKGKSLEQISGALGVTYRTLCRWRDEYEEFCHALEEAKIREMIWWEDHAQSYLVEHKDGEKLNVGLWSRSMAARFPRKYSERIKQELTGADGAPLKGVEISFIDPNASKPAD
jgi:hypothetical protein